MMVQAEAIFSAQCALVCQAAGLGGMDHVHLNCSSSSHWCLGYPEAHPKQVHQCHVEHFLLVLICSTSSKGQEAATWTSELGKRSISCLADCDYANTLAIDWDLLAGLHSFSPGFWSLFLLAFLMLETSLSSQGKSSNILEILAAAEPRFCSWWRETPPDLGTITKLVVLDLSNLSICTGFVKLLKIESSTSHHLALRRSSVSISIRIA